MGNEKILNNINLKLIKTDKFTRNIITVNFFTPLGESASANALLAGVMKLGCQKYQSQTEINEFLESNYGATFNSSVSKKGENQLVRFSTSFISDNFALDGEKISDQMMEFIYQVIRFPLLENGKFKQNYIDIEKKNLIDNIESKINNKRRYVLHRCIETMCANEAYSLDELGIPENIKTLNSDKLYESYETLLKNSEVLVTFVGRFDDNQIELFSKKLFDFPRKSEIAKTLFVEQAEDITEAEEVLDINQSVLAIGFRIGAKDYNDHMFSYMMMNSIFGGSPSSFLFMNVREKLSLCYFCSSMLDRMKGIMISYAGIASENREKTQSEILNQLERIKNGDISDDDMESAYKSLINQYNQVTDDLFSLEYYYLSCFIGDNNMTIEEIKAGFSAVTKEDVKRVANLVSTDTIFFLKGSKEVKEGSIS